ncbi:MAG: hypothetical protein KC561_15665, partial [Myxococcales bacterium]|nr:hypothetical protein [Myxococcales bacterium]
MKVLMSKTKDLNMLVSTAPIVAISMIVLGWLSLQWAEGYWAHLRGWQPAADESSPDTEPETETFELSHGLDLQSGALSVLSARMDKTSRTTRMS